MNEVLGYTIVLVSLITALFLAWFFYQQARNKERLLLIERGEKLEDIFMAHKKSKIKFIFPWLKLGIVILSISSSFILIGLVFLFSDYQYNVFLEFLRPAIIGICLSAAMFINHYLSDRSS